MGKAKSAFFLIVVVLGLIILPQSLHVHAQTQANGPVVSIDPQDTLTQDINSNFTIYVHVENVLADLNVAGVQVFVTYDPTVLNVTQAVEGPFMPSFGPTASVTHAAENHISQPPTGQVSYSSAIIGLAAANGGGILLNVTFRVVSEGSSHIHLGVYRPGSSEPNGTYFMSSNIVSGQYGEVLPSALQDGDYGTPVSLSVKPDVINVGEQTTLTGAVTGSAGATVSSVTLEYGEVGENLTDLAVVPLNSSGFFSYQWTANQTGFFEFQVSITTGGKTVTGLIALVTVVDVTSHLYLLYYALAALVIVIGAAVVVPFVRKRRKIEQLPSDT